MGRLIDQEDGHFPLLLAVLPAFVEALPPRHQTSSDFETDEARLEFKNSTILLRNEIKEMQNIITEERIEYELPAKDFSTAFSVVNNTLHCFEDLVSLGTDNVSACNKGSLVKLNFLRDHISSPKTSRASQGAAKGTTSARASISYGYAATHYYSTYLIAEKFNETIRRILSFHPAEREFLLSQSVAMHTDFREDEGSTVRDAAALEVAQARAQSEIIKAAFMELTGKPKPCQTPHAAYICLNGHPEPELDMILSSCHTHTDNRGPRRWHQTYWTRKTQHNQLSSTTLAEKGLCICNLLEKWKPYRTFLRLNLDDGSWKPTQNRPSDRRSKPIDPPQDTLQKVLAHKLPKEDRLSLGLAIARSLLYLLDGPLLQGRWSADTVYVEREKSGPKPYIFREMVQKVADGGSNNLSRASQLSIDLGKMLWHLLCGQEVVVEPEDEEDDELWSLFNALNRECEEKEDIPCFEQPYILIVKECLNLAGPFEDDEIPFLREVYHRVIVPLKTCHDAHFPEAQSKRHEEPQREEHLFSMPEVDYEVDSPERRKHCASIRTQQIPIRVHTPIDDAERKSALDTHICSTRANLLERSRHINSSETWLDVFDDLNQEHSIPTHKEFNVKPVRIAVLDTGCDRHHDYFAAAGSGHKERLKDRWYDFLRKSEKAIDDDKNLHGTSMVTLLLRLLPQAEIFVARVARDVNDLGFAQMRIAQAIDYASKEWDVDIISMSFGFRDIVPCIENAVQDAHRRKLSRILFFAAANNQGLNKIELFPASSKLTISVRGTNHDGAFITEFNPPAYDPSAIAYGTISEKVPCDWTRGTLVKSGCSVATPIVVAIAATIIQFVSFNKTDFDADDAARIREQAGMLSVFELMTAKQEKINYHRRYLSPWQLFDGVDPVVCIKFALSQLQRRCNVPVG